MTLAVTQLMSWAVAPLHLCISKNGSVCVEIGDESCICCSDGDHEKHGTELSACCEHCDADKSDVLPVVAWTNPCDCTHIPLMIEQDDSIRASVVSHLISWDVPLSWLYVSHEVVPQTVSALDRHWDRRNDPSRHPVALTTTVLRC